MSCPCGQPLPVVVTPLGTFPRAGHIRCHTCQIREVRAAMARSEAAGEARRERRHNTDYPPGVDPRLVGPCARCQTLHERYGRNGRPLCVSCAPPPQDAA